MRLNKKLLVAGAFAMMMSALTQAALVAYEDFDFSGALSSAGNIGTGWAGAWSVASGVDDLTASGLGTSLHFGQSPALISDGSTHVWAGEPKGDQRDITAPIDLASETVYFTALVRAYPGDGSNGGNPPGATDADLRFGFFEGAGASNNLIANVGISDGTLFASAATDGYLAGATNSAGFVDDTTYLLAMKRDNSNVYASFIVADGLYSTLESEPTSWQVTDSGVSAADLGSIRLLTGGDLDGGIRIDEIRIATSWTGAVGSLVVPPPPPSTNKLIASDSFYNTGDMTGYTVGGLSTTPNVTPAGTTGFGTEGVDQSSWQGATSDIKTDNIYSLSHSGVTGSARSGHIAIRSYSANRNNSRALVGTLPTATSYYLSGLVRANTDGYSPRDAYHKTNQQRVMGMMDTIAANTFNTTNGFFVGVNTDPTGVYLAAFSGGSAYNLLNITNNYDETFQIVAKLDVDASGNETLSAWYAADGATNLTLALNAQNVGDIWQDAGDLDTFVVQTKATGQLSDWEPFDEMRFGTELDVVSTLPAETAPPPVVSDLIAAESFAIGTGGYVDEGALGNAGDVTPTGTTGFGTAGDDASSWTGGTGEILTDDGYSLTHSALTGTAQPGAAGPRSALSRDRNSARALVGTTIATSYYLSGLVATSGTNSLGTAGQQRNMGFMDTIAPSTYNIGEGFFLGINVTAGGTQNLAVFANDVAYNLFDLSSHLGDTFQIVAKLDVNAVGNNETLTAWFAADGATNLTLALDAQDVGDIWQDAGDLDTFVVQTDSNEDLSAYQPFDEMRFGTTLEVVSTLPAETAPAADPYDTWSSEQGLTAGVNDGLLDDAEAGGGDGVNNLLEYALGGDPLVDDADSILPVASLDANGSWFYYVHTERTDVDNLTYTVELDEDLVADPTWSTNGVSRVGESATDPNGLKSVTNRTDVGAAEYLRLRVNKN